ELVGQRLEPHEALNARHELHVVDGLGEKVVGPRFETPYSVGGFVEGCYHQHGDVLGLTTGLEPAADLEAIHLRHHDIEEYDVDVLALADGEGLASGGGGDDFAVLGAQAGLEQAHVRWNIVNDQDARRQWRLPCRKMRKRLAGGSNVARNCFQKVRH